ncbi:Band 4.1-like protein 1 [Hypsibius exemplaris]|uniref:Band 4.1-like protein 1 n=1 Tax=Hypsibius exemplaris TaxID=2072580 RepID=A0A9X6RL75_HYPEX|nr:Band 4.1-like protein 1 [Hypsibius exemplaris]
MVQGQPQEAVAYRGDHNADASSLEGGDVVMTEKEMRRLDKERKEEEKRMKQERERAEKNARKEHERLEKLAKQREKEQLKEAKKNGSSKNINNGNNRIEESPPSPAYLDEDRDQSLERSPPVSPVGIYSAPGKTSTLPATYEHVTEEISAQGAGPGIYATNTMKSNFSVNTNGRQKDVVVPVIPADRTATPTGQSKSGAQAKATVRLLSDQDAEFSIPKNATGQMLFDRVCDFINLQEKDYFGIRFVDTDNEKSWLNMEKTVKQQTKNNPWAFEFLVKFYPPQPTELKEDLTRYYLCMQIHRDLITERLPASFTTYAILGSLMVQSELGDYDRSRHIGNYVSEVPLAPPNKQNAELEDKVMELHKENTRGMPPTEADLRYLENAKRLAFYGVDLHKAKDKENIDIKVGVSGSGVHVYRDNLRINRFAWPKILKISYRRNTFYIKVRPQEFGESEQEIAFRCPYQKAAKRLWKVCVEHHTFFRTKSSEEPSGYDTMRWPRLGSRFRYSGRTYSEAKASSEMIDRPAPEFNRTWSRRNPYSVSVEHGLSSVGRQQSGEDRPVSASEYDGHRRSNGSNVYDRPAIIGRGQERDGRQGANGGLGANGGYGQTVYQTDYTRQRLTGDDDDESRGGASSLLTDNVTTQEYRTAGHLGRDGNSRDSSVLSSPESTLKSRRTTEFTYQPGGWGGGSPASPIHGPHSPSYDASGLASSTPYKGYRPYSPSYSTSATGFRLDGNGNPIGGSVSPGGTVTSTRYNRQEYYVDPSDPAKGLAKIPAGGVGVMTTTYGNVTEYTSRTKTTTSTIKSTIEKYPGFPGGPTDSTTLTTRSINGPTMSSTSEPLGSPTRKTETHNLGRDGPQVVSTKVKTIETTTFEVDRNGEKETHVEEKVTILADGEDLDHDKALREAIQQATNLNPNFEVEKLEIDHEETDH